MIRTASERLTIVPTRQQLQRRPRTEASSRRSEAPGYGGAHVPPAVSGPGKAGGETRLSGGTVREAGRLSLHGLLWGTLALAIVLVVVVGLMQRLRIAREADLPVYGLVPDFALTERTGRSVSAAELHGHVWVANFIFTRCTGICPALSAQMAAVQRQLRRGDGLAVGGVRDDMVRFVSFSVDPQHDTPAVLRDYAKRFGADPERWLFVTGSRAEVHRLVRDGFHLGITEPPEGGVGEGRAAEPILHSDRFVLVDRQRQIRGYYHGTDEREVADLIRHVAWLRDRNVNQ